jgi:hypothetical protein
VVTASQAIVEASHAAAPAGPWRRRTNRGSMRVGRYRDRGFSVGHRGLRHAGAARCSVADTLAYESVVTDETDALVTAARISHA